MIDAHERKPTGLDWSRPSEAPHKLEHRLPGWDEIPEEFKDEYSVAPPAGKAKAGIEADVAENHYKYIQNSWEYSSEHKYAAMKWLHSMWFEPVESHGTAA